MPTSRATRVTSPANAFSWSTIVLMVSFSSRISPLTLTVIFLDRSPLAMAVATSAMFRTCAVRLLAMKLTLSVRSFQVPATPGTCAWPPSLPSVPTSRATRVTSDAKALSWSTIVLMVFFSSRISPRTSTVILRERSPRATAVVTSAMLRTWSVRLRAIALTESVRSFHVPATPGTTAWPPSRPSVPTSCATRVTSDANDRSWSTIVLMASFSCRISPRTSTVILRDRSPLATAMVTSEMLRTWPVRLLAIELTLSVRSFQTPLTFADLRLAAELAVGADLARDARHLRREHAELLDHRVDDGGGAQELAFERPAVDVEPHRLQQVALGDGRERARHFGRRPQQVVDQRVDRRLHLAPGAARSAELDALTRLALLADDRADAFELARHPGVGGDDLVEGVGDLAVEAGPVAGQPHREVAVAYRLQGG